MSVENKEVLASKEKVSNYKFFFDILLVSLLEYVGDSSFKKYSKSKSDYDLFLGIISYAVVIYLLIHILKYSNVMQMNIQWDALSAILETALAYVLLKETLSGITQYIGFALIILGMIFMNLGKYNYQ
jgi:multidrug transporter EmrE-like cation transporter